MDNNNNNNNNNIIIENFKSLINEDNIKISENNKQILLVKIEQYINFIKSKSETPEKIQTFENICKD